MKQFTSVNDINSVEEMIALAFSTTPDNWRRVAHIISDKIYQRLTGEDGYFDTRIIYVSETGTVPLIFTTVPSG